MTFELSTPPASDRPGRLLAVGEFDGTPLDAGLQARAVRSAPGTLRMRVRVAGGGFEWGRDLTALCRPASRLLRNPGA